MLLRYRDRDLPGGLSNGGGVGLIPGQGPKTPRASQPKSRDKEQKRNCNEFKRL